MRRDRQWSARFFPGNPATPGLPPSTARAGCAPAPRVRFEITATLGRLSGSAALTSVPLPERRVLQAIYEAGGGALWKENTNWLTDAPLSEWHGVLLDDDGQVQHLLLTGNGLIGTIPPEIASLTRLESLHIGENSLAGPLPPEIGHLRRLKSLELTYNAHTGPIPPEIGNLAELEWFWRLRQPAQRRDPPRNRQPDAARVARPVLQPPHWADPDRNRPPHAAQAPGALRNRLQSRPKGTA